MPALVVFLTGTMIFMSTLRIVSGGADQYADLVKLHGLLRTADDRLVCQTGSGYIDFCTIAGKATLSDVFSCFYNSLLNGPVKKDLEMYFDSTFLTRPNVAVFTSGLSSFAGISYNITVAKVTPTGLTVQATGLPAPFSVRFNYVACDQQVLFPKAYLDVQERIAYYSDQ